MYDVASILFSLSRYTISGRRAEKFSGIREVFDVIDFRRLSTALTPSSVQTITYNQYTLNRQKIVKSSNYSSITSPIPVASSATWDLL